MSKTDHLDRTLGGLLDPCDRVDVKLIPQRLSWLRPLGTCLAVSIQKQKILHSDQAF